MQIGFIGAGKVGFSLGRYFVENGLKVSGYYSRDIQSRTEAAKFTGSAVFDDIASLLRKCDTVFITVPDSAIREVYEQVRDVGIAGRQICHCSGAMSALEAFPDIARYGGSGCSIHPLFPVSSKYDSFKELGHAFFCLEGNEAHVMQWKKIFEDIGNPVRVISGSHKCEYHAACAVSSNLMCALAEESVELMKKCGFSENEALAALQPLVMSNIRHIFKVGPSGALTGPVERNDVQTVQKHIECMSKESDRSMYKAVSRKLVEVAQKRHPDSDYRKMNRVLL
ncbi:MULTISPECIES: Rossmann-like and DUF2520 domain-containing protein [Ruminococcus]|uniref:Predicted oxidoreductase, contains short-chain dehydrogenase (SDR) and DUF2520 domains n=1 Tax=Ruminococcus flavefaciens TaxID=1265 RepID=A0A1M7IYR8_RUMFL|nr:MULTISPECIES: Rossmann-like and DUF2520 domain-containing protein [Ruminococcus]MCR4793731.1 DUF2520 domain-containing protein [Ruminococcus sp.]SHM45852.1 Predicted oxidoreductase, contains short-chain dehydrogenase (SDR) and DUF2520 domains [Ruminococcus flavefaciens]